MEGIPRCARLFFMQDEYIPLVRRTPVQIQEVLVKVLDTTEWEGYKAERWECLCRERGITENATLLRVEEAHDSCVLVSPSITYQDIVGLRYGNTLPAVPYHALSALAVIQTADDHYVLQIRDSGDWPRSYELSGGFVRAQSVQLGVVTTVDDFIARRASAELAPLSLHSWQCYGAIRYSSILEHMYIYQVRTQETAAEVQALLGEQVISVAPSDIEAVVTEHIPLPLLLHPPSQTVLRHILAAQKHCRSSEITNQQSTSSVS